VWKAGESEGKLTVGRGVQIYERKFSALTERDVLKQQAARHCWIGS
jgi:hypothetical protein